MKLSEAALDHLPGHVVAKLTTGSEAELRMVNGVCKLIELGSSRYFYRGFEISLDETVTKGYDGRWTLVDACFKLGVVSLVRCKQIIDKYLGSGTEK